MKAEIEFIDICEFCNETVPEEHACYQHEIRAKSDTETRRFQRTHLTCGDKINADKRHYRCSECDVMVAIGDWPYCPHGKAQPSKGFEPYWDWNISTTPQWISNPGDKRKHLKPHWVNDNIVHLQERR